jgi:23S rRNA pseudouridine2604 synthase
MTDEPQRLSKVVAALVPCSRSAAEQYIVERWVRVNGKVVDKPQERVGPDDKVEVNTRTTLQPAEPATIIVNKRAGMGTAAAQALIGGATHWSGDTSGVRRIKSHDVGLLSLLPLPDEAEGLAVFSQDGRIVRKLREDARLIEQELVAQVTGTIAPNGLERLGAGLRFEGQPLPRAHVSWQSEQRLRFAAKDIRPEVIPWMCAQVGLQLTALRRIRIGRVPMAGLPEGQWRYLAADEKF